VASPSAAIRTLALRATPLESALLNFWISFDQDDWKGVLGQAPRIGDKFPGSMKSFEIRALGELGRLDEMTAAYASAARVVTANNLLSCGLFVLAFSGRVDGVRRCLLSRQLQSLRSRDKTYWILVASQAAGINNEDARRALELDARDATDSEVFRRRAGRLLEAAPTLTGPALSAESVATISAIEDTLTCFSHRIIARSGEFARRFVGVLVGAPYRGVVIRERRWDFSGAAEAANIWSRWAWG
jgi:hypothetical protein